MAGSQAPGIPNYSLPATPAVVLALADEREVTRHNAFRLVHLVATDRPDGRSHPLSDHLVEHGLDATESDHKATWSDRTATPLGVSNLEEVREFLLDAAAGQTGLAGELGLGVGDGAVLGVVIGRTDRSGEQTVVLAQVQHDDAASQLVGGAVVGSSFDGRQDGFPRGCADLLVQTSEHSVHLSGLNCVNSETQFSWEELCLTVNY